jgi:hypothetical protein
MDKISDNQSWPQDNIQHCHQSEETIEEVNALSTKMDNLLNWLDQRAKYKEDQRAIEKLTRIQILPSERFHINQVGNSKTLPKV